MSKKERDRRYDKKRAGQRTRNWTFIVYPESAADDWRELLEEEHLEWIESPLHDRDVNATGEPKKPHIHVLVLYQSVKTFEQVKPLTELLKATMPQRCANAKALVRYMAHLDNPEKAQYDVGGIVGHGGVDVAELLRPSASERYALIREMMEYVRQNGIVEMCDLMEYAMTERFDDWFPLLCDNCAYVVGAVIKSYRHKGVPTRTHRFQSDDATRTHRFQSAEGEDVRVDPETGEVLD